MKEIWEALPVHYPSIGLDEFVVMPNHFHGIVAMQEGDFSLADAVHRFKSLTTARYRQGVHGGEYRAFEGRLWQRNYYERVLRNQEEVESFRRYIAKNPENWHADPENPMVCHPGSAPG